MSPDWNTACQSKVDNNTPFTRYNRLSNPWQPAVSCKRGLTVTLLILHSICWVHASYRQLNYNVHWAFSGFIMHLLYLAIGAAQPPLYRGQLNQSTLSVRIYTCWLLHAADRNGVDLVVCMRWSGCWPVAFAPTLTLIMSLPVISANLIAKINTKAILACV